MCVPYILLIYIFGNDIDTHKYSQRLLNMTSVPRTSLELVSVGHGFWEGEVGALWVQATRVELGFDTVAFVVRGADLKESEDAAFCAGQWLVQNASLIQSCTFVLGGLSPGCMWWHHFEQGMVRLRFASDQSCSCPW